MDIAYGNADPSDVVAVGTEIDAVAALSHQLDLLPDFIGGGWGEVVINLERLAQNPVDMTVGHRGEKGHAGRSAMGRQPSPPRERNDCLGGKQLALINDMPALEAAEMNRFLGFLMQFEQDRHQPGFQIEALLLLCEQGQRNGAEAVTEVVAFDDPAALDERACQSKHRRLPRLKSLGQFGQVEPSLARQDFHQGKRAVDRG